MGGNNSIKKEMQGRKKRGTIGDPKIKMGW